MSAAYLLPNNKYEVMVVSYDERTSNRKLRGRIAAFVICETNQPKEVLATFPVNDYVKIGGYVHVRQDERRQSNRAMMLCESMNRLARGAA